MLLAKVMLDAVPLHRHRIMQRLRLMVELPPGAVTGAVAGAVIGTVTCDDPMEFKPKRNMEAV